MPNQEERLFEAIAAPQPGRRMDAYGALTLLRAGDRVEGEYVLRVAGVILNSFPLRSRTERAAIGRFFETWFIKERSVEISRRLAAARMEEVHEDIRDSLLAAEISAMPSDDLIETFSAPPKEHLHGGLGLLMMLEALSYRVREREFTSGETPLLLKALRSARALRGSHIARPFLWRLEDVIAQVRELVSRFRL
jgi:hypothetical protein